MKTNRKTFYPCLSGLLCCLSLWIGQAQAAVPTTPTSTSPGSATSPGTTLSGNTVTLTWDMVSGATYYTVFVRDVATDTLVVNITTPSASHLATLKAGKQYRWNVVAGNTAGKSDYTAVRFFQTPEGETIRKGVDYFSAKPPPIPGKLKAAGYDFVIRYVSHTAESEKNITADEARDLQAAELDIIVIFESFEGRMKGGKTAGVEDAKSAVTQATAAGAPENFFCYFACDYAAPLGDQPLIDAYLDGAASVLGGVNRVGFYGGYSQVKRVLDAGKAAKAWQTTSFSDGMDPRISLYQYKHDVPIPGVLGRYDMNEGYGADLGQWTVSPPSAPNANPPASFPSFASIDGTTRPSTPPSLGYTRQGNNLVLSWSTNDPAFKLEYATHLPASIWSSNQVSPSVVSGQYIVTIAITGDIKFYRLKK